MPNQRVKKVRVLGILRCEEDLLCKSIEVLGETAFALFSKNISSYFRQTVV